MSLALALGLLPMGASALTSRFEIVPEPAALALGAVLLSIARPRRT